MAILAAKQLDAERIIAMSRHADRPQHVGRRRQRGDQPG
jgi:hypothetical protein